MLGIQVVSQFRLHLQAEHLTTCIAVRLRHFLILEVHCRPTRRWPFDPT